MAAADLSLTERLAHHLTREISDADRRRARLHLLDWLGCVLGARRSGVAKLGIAGARERATWLGNVLEMDDVHRTAILHPGPIVWPAAIRRAGEIDPALDAAITGYDAVIAIGSTFDARHYAFHHNTATAGTFGAAAAAAAHLGLPPPEMASAFGLAGSVTGGLWQMRHEPGEAKQWHVTHAVSTGVAAARAAKAGVRGPARILEGPQGLHRATCDAPKLMELTDHWRIHEVSFKPWAACRHAHPSIDAALQLSEKDALRGKIRVETYADAIAFCDRPDPRTVIDAKFSIQHAVAIVAERGTPSPRDFEPEAIEALAPVRARVSVAEAPDITARYPVHFGARISTPADNIELVDTRGDPERPLSDEGIEAKARELMAWGGLTDRDTDEAVASTLDAVDTEALARVLEKHL